jgi:hypothetical protein
MGHSECGEMDITVLDPVYFEQIEFPAAFSVAVTGFNPVWLFSSATDTALMTGQYSPALELSQHLKVIRPGIVSRQMRDAAMLDRFAQPLFTTGYGLHLKRIQKETVY